MVRLETFFFRQPPAYQKKKTDTLYCLARKTPFDRGWVCKKKKKRLKKKRSL